MVHPGFVTAAGAAELNAALARLRKLEEAFLQTSRVDFDQLDRPWMKLTGRYSGNGLYAWTEADFTTGGAFYDKVGGRSGTVNGLAGATVTYMPAVEMNGEVITSFPHYVRAEFAVVGSSRVYYFKSNAPASSVAAVKGYYALSSPVAVPSGSFVELGGGTLPGDSNLSTDTTGIHLIAGSVAIGYSSAGAYNFIVSINVSSGTVTTYPPMSSGGPGGGGCAAGALVGFTIPVCQVVNVTAAPAAFRVRVTCGLGGLVVSTLTGGTITKI